MECRSYDIKIYASLGKNFKRDRNFGISNCKGEVAKQFSECHRRTTVLQVASNDDQRGPSVKRNGTPDNNSWLRFCVVRNRESRIGTLPLASPEMFSMIVRT
ncbi:hypothetical protein TNCV_1163861 [Trichonephila clavipes]|nr:hypothetical protein TNCV_1163861 [Trichonephila clavipes]